MDGEIERKRLTLQLWDMVAFQSDWAAEVFQQLVLIDSLRTSRSSWLSRGERGKTRPGDCSHGSEYMLNTLVAAEPLETHVLMWTREKEMDI